MKIAICDDNVAFTGELERLLFQICNENQIKIISLEVFFCGDNLLSEMKAGEVFDLFYLDIGMKPDGITLAKEIRRINEKALFIFISTHRECCEQLFEVDTFDFIRKPIEKSRIVNVLLRAYGKISNMRQKEFFSYTYRFDENQILLDSIIYFRSVGRQIEIYLSDGDIKVYNGKLNDVEDTLIGRKKSFLRIHQSYLVSYEWIVSYNKNIVTMANHQTLPISADRRDGFIHSFNILVGGDISE